MRHKKAAKTEAKVTQTQAHSHINRNCHGNAHCAETSIGTISSASVLRTVMAHRTTQCAVFDTDHRHRNKRGAYTRQPCSVRRRSLILDVASCRSLLAPCSHRRVRLHFFHKIGSIRSVRHTVHTARSRLPASSRTVIHRSDSSFPFLFCSPFAVSIARLSFIGCAIISGRDRRGSRHHKWRKQS